MKHKGSASPKTPEQQVKDWRKKEQEYKIDDSSPLRGFYAGLGLSMIFPGLNR